KKKKLASIIKSLTYNMEIQHTIASRGEFFMENNQHEKLANMTYRMENDNTIVIEHTNVDRSLAGQGIGKKLIESAVHYARKNSLKIKAVCTYALAVFQKTESYADVWLP
ncbi:MAG TPA: GNAT family N-acetyltransferase, partial [Chitinophagales bacterium]|nr:GNAT family N-acetyltransferase [Chitinophagales bacterium]